MSWSYILIADDDPTIRTLLTEVLEDEGYTVRAYNDGFDALCAARAATPTLLILDIAMPVMTGDEVLRRLRAEGFDGPVVVATAATEPARFLQHGATRVLPKPFELHTLLETIAELTTPPPPLRAIAFGESPEPQPPPGRQTH
jgi:CheY-like chemotaxis protein